MSLSSHLEELRRKHRTLSEKGWKAGRTEAPSNGRSRNKSRSRVQKLRVKEEIGPSIATPCERSRGGAASAEGCASKEEKAVFADRLSDSVFVRSCPRGSGRGYCPAVRRQWSSRLVWKAACGPSGGVKKRPRNGRSRRLTPSRPTRESEGRGSALVHHLFGDRAHHLGVDVARGRPTVHAVIPARAPSTGRGPSKKADESPRLRRGVVGPARTALLGPLIDEIVTTRPNFRSRMPAQTFMGHD